MAAAAASVIDSLLIMLGLDPTGVQKGIDKAEDLIHSNIPKLNDQAEINPDVDTTNFKSGFAEMLNIADGTVQQIIGKLSAIGAAYFTFAGIESMANEFVAGADAAAKMSRQLGVNMEELQAWNEAIKRSGGDADSFRGVLEQMTADLTDLAVNGESEQTIYYQKMGVAIKDAEGKVRSAFDVMTDMAGAFEKMDARESMGIGRILGLDNGTIQLLQGGKKNVEELIQREKELGVYTKRDAEIAEKFNGIMDDFKQSMRSIFSVVFRPVFEWLTKLLEKGVQITKFLNQHQPFLQAFFAGLAIVITTKLIPAFAKLAVAILTNPITLVIAAMAALAAIIDDLVTYAQGGNSAFKGLWDAIFGSPEGAMKAYKTVKENVTTIIVAAKKGWQELKTAWHNFIEYITKLPQAFLDSWNNILKQIDAAIVDFASGFAAVWNTAWGGFPETISEVMAAVKGVWNTAITAIGSAVTEIVKIISKAWTGLTDVFLAVANGIRTAWEALFNWFVSKFEWLSDKLSGLKEFASGITDTFTNAKTPTPVIPRGGTGGGGNHTTTTNSNITVQNVNVQTQATDAKGIAGGIGGALKDDLGKRIVANAQTGVNQKG